MKKLENLITFVLLVLCLVGFFAVQGCAAKKCLMHDNTHHCCCEEHKCECECAECKKGNHKNCECHK